MVKQKILCVLGTRPEAIKMAPVILALKDESWVEVRVLATAQHRHLMDQVKLIFGIEPDIDLNVMQPKQALAPLNARLLLELDKVLQAEKPNAVLVQGDTTTMMAAAMACYYQQIPFGHVEAGLRTWDMQNPFPEEANRVIAGKLAKWHFVPTEGSRQNLMKEGTLDADIFVTGNTVIDALLMTANKNLVLPVHLDSEKRLILVTAHRRENFGEPFLNICRALRSLAENNSSVQFLYPVHPNPNIKNVAYELLTDLPNFILCEPLNYLHFVAAMKRSYIILTDSGGVQEEAPALGKPVLVMRDETERPEAVEQGMVKLVGRKYKRIVDEVQFLLDNETAYSAMIKDGSPYGDGNASGRIVLALRDHFKVPEKDKTIAKTRNIQRQIPEQFINHKHVEGDCNVCGNYGRFFYPEPALYRETLICEHCRSSSRYRSLARGILKKINNLIDNNYKSLSALPKSGITKKIIIYDTQVYFDYLPLAYINSDILSKCDWIEVHQSIYKKDEALGKDYKNNTTNQNLEQLTYDDNIFDIVITSDVMEHVRLDNKAHSEIKRILKPGGVYLFTVPHSRNMDETLVRVDVKDEDDPLKDKFLMEPEYHGDTNSDENMALSYRVYGLDLDQKLNKLGMDVKFTRDDFPKNGILNTELFYCTLKL